MHNRVDEAGASGTGLGSADANSKINVVKVFTATKAKDRASMGDVVNAWISDNPDVRVLKTVVVQSSDSEYHCLSIVLIGSR